MSMTFSRSISAATLAYAGYCFAQPEHLPRAMGWRGERVETGKKIAYVLGARDAAIGLVGVLGDAQQVRRAMQVRILFDVVDSAVLAPAGAGTTEKVKIAGVALGYGAVNLAALTADSRRARQLSQLALLTTGPAAVQRLLS